jgi:mannonate dehydratase
MDIHIRRHSRRTFVSTAAACAAAAAWSGAAKAAEVIPEEDPANIKLGREVNAHTVTDDDLAFLKQIGVRWVRLQLGREEVSLDFLRSIRDRCALQGIRIYDGVHVSYQSPAIALGLAGRDRDIEKYQKVVRDLGRVGIPVAGYDFFPGNTFATGSARRRGYITREFNLADLREKQAFERQYPAEELWKNYAYFMKAMLPGAEAAGVQLALHPDDPPVPRMNGVERIFNHYEGYRRAEQIAGGSRHWGLLFCVGTWSEGGDRMGKTVVEMIRDFGARGRILEVHFRNVSAPLPHFLETLPDDGYVNMYQVMKTLREVRYQGFMGPDHVPRLAGDEGILRSGTAYCLTYMRTLLRRANEEVG